MIDSVVTPDPDDKIEDMDIINVEDDIIDEDEDEDDDDDDEEDIED